MDNLNVLVEAKKEYLGQMCHLMVPVMIETFSIMYDEAVKISKGRKVLQMFQKHYEHSILGFPCSKHPTCHSDIDDRLSWVEQHGYVSVMPAP